MHTHDNLEKEIKQIFVGADSLGVDVLNSTKEIIQLLEAHEKELIGKIEEIDPKTFMDGLTAEQWQGANTMKGFILNKIQKEEK